MPIFFSALIAVAVLLLVASPGYIFIKKGFVSDECISAFSKLLLFVCQPALVLYTFISTEFSVEILRDLGVFVIASILIHAVMLGSVTLILRKRFSSVAARISTIAVTFANSAFFGIPIIEAVMGERALGLVIYTTVYAMVMNLLGWTVGSAIISKSKRYITAKKLFINPYMISVLIALPLFIFSPEIPGQLSSMITVLGKATSPISMIIIGMRLAKVDLKKLLTNARIYLVSFTKLVVMPTVAFAIIYFFPIGADAKSVFYIIAACPTASIVLNFSELIGEGQEEAVSSVLMATVLSVVTLPFMMLMLPLF
ncbi:MAG: AEC family transporter [Clostridia bacterium]|nr:AEC family transporter [Clostridia bacterium]